MVTIEIFRTRLAPSLEVSPDLWTSISNSSPRKTKNTIRSAKEKKKSNYLSTMPMTT